MATLAPPNLYKMYGLLNPHLSSLRIGGIVGDVRHVAGGGYHISREDLRSHGQGSDYSIQAPADKRGASNYAAAIDISLNPAEMVQVSKRLKSAMEGADYDPRIEPLREFIGTVDNKNVCGYNRWQTVGPGNYVGRRTGWYASGYSESSHLWHVHLSFFRDYCNNANDIAGVAEVVCGLKAGTLGWKQPSDNVAPVKPKPAGPWHGTLYLIKPTKAYGPKGHYIRTFPAGRKFTGTVDTAYAKRVGSEGRYFRVLVGLGRRWLPLDDHNFSHTKNGKAI